MEMPAYHEQAPVQVLRYRRGVVIGRLEHQRLIGKTLARDVRGSIVGSFDHRANITRDARGTVVGTCNLLPVLLPLPR